MLREHAQTIWQAGVDAARPETLVANALSEPQLRQALTEANRILVVGAGKAGAPMACAVEAGLDDMLEKVEGLVNVPAGPPFETRKIKLHSARPTGSNQPTAEGVIGAEEILDLLSHAGPDDVALCLISGGGSALLPAPVEKVSLEDKQTVTQLLHGCGATINEMNAVRKHLSRVKGGQLAQAFTGRSMHSLIISDVIGDPLDVIASGPTAADPSTFRESLEVLERYAIVDQAPPSVRAWLEKGKQGDTPETLKTLPEHIHNHILGNNAHSLQICAKTAEALGYKVLNLGSFIEGETKEVATVLSGILASVLKDDVPTAPPVCILSGGETTVNLGNSNGKGGRNQEFVLSAITHIGDSLNDHAWVILSGGTDGEDGPTDAAGAIADQHTLTKADSPQAHLTNHDAYHFFEPLGDLLKTGLTWTNVMDIRVMLAQLTE